MAEIRPGDDVEIWTGEPSRLTRVAYAIVRGLILLVAKIVGRVTIVGAEKVPAAGAFVLAPVHRSNVDFALGRARDDETHAVHGEGLDLEVEALGPVRLDAGCVPRPPRECRSRRAAGLHGHRHRGQPAGDVPGGHPVLWACHRGALRRHGVRGGQGWRADHPRRHRGERGHDAQGRQDAPAESAGAHRGRPDPGPRPDREGSSAAQRRERAHGPVARGAAGPVRRGPAPGRADRTARERSS